MHRRGTRAEGMCFVVCLLVAAMGCGGTVPPASTVVPTSQSNDISQANQPPVAQASPAPADEEPSLATGQAAGKGRNPVAAVGVCRPEGEMTYLGRIRCADGSAVTVLGRVSVGIRQPLAEGQDQLALEQLERVPAAGEPDLHVVDRYEVRCGNEASYVYLDMYHCTGTEETSPPAGFSLAAANE